MWRLTFSKYKLKSQDREKSCNCYLTSTLTHVDLSCLSFMSLKMQRLGVIPVLKSLKNYYSAKCEPICVYCRIVTSFTDKKYTLNVPVVMKNPDKKEYYYFTFFLLFIFPQFCFFSLDTFTLLFSGSFVFSSNYTFLALF